MSSSELSGLIGNWLSQFWLFRLISAYGARIMSMNTGPSDLCMEESVLVMLERRLAEAAWSKQTLSRRVTSFIFLSGVEMNSESFSRLSLLQLAFSFID